MKYTKIRVDHDDFYVGFDDRGYTFIGTPNGDENEIHRWFKDAYRVEDKAYDIQEMIRSYLNHEIKDIAVDTHMIGTDFQKRVWKKLQEIPYGSLATYSDIAQSLGDIKKVRAVAHAIAKNPLLLIVPCHRVVGKDGHLRGFRAGLLFKEKLIALENK